MPMKKSYVYYSMEWVFSVFGCLALHISCVLPHFSLFSLPKDYQRPDLAFCCVVAGLKDPRLCLPSCPFLCGSLFLNLEGWTLLAHLQPIAYDRSDTVWLQSDMTGLLSLGTLVLDASCQNSAIMMWGPQTTRRGPGWLSWSAARSTCQHWGDHLRCVSSPPLRWRQW